MDGPFLLLGVLVKTKLIIILIFLINFNLYAENKCLEYYLNNKVALNEFNQNLESLEANSYVIEVGDYCDCEKKILNKYKNWLDFAFEDPKRINNDKDNCSVKSFSKANIDIFYNINLYYKFNSLISEKINEYSIQGLTMVSSETQSSNYFSCVYEEVSQNCFKVSSLNMTHQCINDSFVGERYNQIYKNCSLFLLETPTHIKIDLNNDNFI